MADLNCHARLLAVSEATRRFHVAAGLDGQKARVVYNGVDLARFRPRPGTGWLHEELGFPADAFLVGGALLNSDDPGALLRSLAGVGEGSEASHG